MLVKTINDAVDTFPYSVRKLKGENPNTSFPKEMPPEALADNLLEMLDMIETKSCLNPTGHRCRTRH